MADQPEPPTPPSAGGQRPSAFHPYNPNTNSGGNHGQPYPGAQFCGPQFQGPWSCINEMLPPNQLSDSGCCFVHYHSHTTRPRFPMAPQFLQQPIYRPQALNPYEYYYPQPGFQPMQVPPGMRFQHGLEIRRPRRRTGTNIKVEVVTIEDEEGEESAPEIIRAEAPPTNSTTSDMKSGGKSDGASEKDTAPKVQAPTSSSTPPSGKEAGLNENLHIPANPASGLPPSSNSADVDPEAGETESKAEGTQSEGQSCRKTENLLNILSNTGDILSSTADIIDLTTDPDTKRLAREASQIPGTSSSNCETSSSRNKSDSVPVTSIPDGDTKVEVKPAGNDGESKKIKPARRSKKTTQGNPPKIGKEKHVSFGGMIQVKRIHAGTKEGAPKREETTVHEEEKDFLRPSTVDSARLSVPYQLRAKKNK